MTIVTRAAQTVQRVGERDTEIAHSCRRHFIEHHTAEYIKSVLCEPTKPFITRSKVLWIIDLLGEIGTFHDS